MSPFWKIHGNTMFWLKFRWIQDLTRELAKAIIRKWMLIIIKVMVSWNIFSHYVIGHPTPILPQGKNWNGFWMQGKTYHTKMWSLAPAPQKNLIIFDRLTCQHNTKLLYNNRYDIALSRFLSFSFAIATALERITIKEGKNKLKQTLF